MVNPLYKNVLSGWSISVLVPAIDWRPVQSVFLPLAQCTLGLASAPPATLTRYKRV
uniref:Uncharacterized protein n=1 Tax=Anguilla anguilla TaxID=7936 RepID=A0A0E9WNB3_ANGAN